MKLKTKIILARLFTAIAAGLSAFYLFGWVDGWIAMIFGMSCAYHAVITYMQVSYEI